MTRKKISLIKKAQELGIIKITKHPATGFRIIINQVPECPDMTDEWEELQRFVNNRRNIILKPKITIQKNSK